MTISGANTKVIVGGGTVNLEKTTTWTGNTGANNNAIQFCERRARSTTTAPSTTPTRSRRSSSTTSAGRTTSTTSAPTTSSSNTITTVDIGVAFNNSGVVNVKAGSFRPSGGTSTGAFNIAAGAVLDFKNGNNTLNSVTTQGAGTLAISSDLVGADAARHHQRRHPHDAVRAAAAAC